MINALLIARKVLSIIDQRGEFRRPGFIPSEAALHKVVEDVFWSSADRYEGNPLYARVYFTPEQAIKGPQIIRLDAPATFSATTLRSLTPVCAPNGGLCAVERDGALQIEGILGEHPIKNADPFWLSVEGYGPAAVRVSIRGEPILEFTRGKLRHVGGMSLDRTAAELLLMAARLFPDIPPGRSWPTASLMLDLGRAVESLGMGGAIWILPHGSNGGDLATLGRRAILNPSWLEPFREMWDLRTALIRFNAFRNKCDPSGDPQEEFQWATQEWDRSRRGAVLESIASLSKVDGAILMTGSPDLLSFGVVCNEFEAPATVTQHSQGSDMHAGPAVEPSEFGGSRHTSAMGFCATYAHAGALVASHDGGLTVFASLKKGSVVRSPVSLLDSEPDVQAQGTSAQS